MLEKLYVMVLTEDNDLRAYVKNHIKSDGIAISGYSDFSSSAVLKVESLLPDVVLCAIKGEVNNGQLSFIQNLFCTLLGCVIILMNDNINVELVNKAAQDGISQVVNLDIDPTELLDCITQAASYEKQRDVEHKRIKHLRAHTIGFFSGKGGTGKTTVCVNTAVALSQKGKRVMLLDYDLQFGDVDLLLDLNPKDTIYDLVLEKEVTIETIKTYSVVHKSGLHVLCSPKSPEGADYVNASQVETIIDIIRPHYDYILIDLPPVFSDVSIAAIENCDELMMVCNMDMLCFKHAKTCLEILDQLQQKEKVRLIINKFNDGLIKVKDFEKICETDVFATVSNDTKVVNNCMNKGSPIVLSKRHTNIAREMYALAQKIAV